MEIASMAGVRKRCPFTVYRLANGQLGNGEVIFFLHGIGFPGCCVNSIHVSRSVCSPAAR